MKAEIENNTLMIRAENDTERLALNYLHDNNANFEQFIILDGSLSHEETNRQIKEPREPYHCDCCSPDTLPAGSLSNLG